jgi:hypothetical protein
MCINLQRTFVFGYGQNYRIAVCLAKGQSGSSCVSKYRLFAVLLVHRKLNNCYIHAGYAFESAGKNAGVEVFASLSIVIA